MTPMDLVERVMELGHERLAESLELMHPDAEWIHDNGRPPLHLHDEIRAFVTEELERLGPEVPEPVMMSLTENGDVVVVYGQLRIPRTEGKRFVEMQQVAWIYEIAGERIARVTMFKTWEAAREAAGIAPGIPPTKRYHSWQLAVAAACERLALTLLLPARPA
jgi:ketosteroid isomerase-like protein